MFTGSDNTTPSHLHIRECLQPSVTACFNIKSHLQQEHSKINNKRNHLGTAHLCTAKQISENVLTLHKLKACICIKWASIWSTDSHCLLVGRPAQSCSVPHLASLVSKTQGFAFQATQCSDGLTTVYTSHSLPRLLSCSLGAPSTPGKWTASGTDMKKIPTPHGAQTHAS